MLILLCPNNATVHSGTVSAILQNLINLSYFNNIATGTVETRRKSRQTQLASPRRQEAKTLRAPGQYCDGELGELRGDSC